MTTQPRHVAECDLSYTSQEIVYCVRVSGVWCEAQEHLGLSEGWEDITIDEIQQAWLVPSNSLMVRWPIDLTAGEWRARQPKDETDRRALGYDNGRAIEALRHELAHDFEEQIIAALERE